MLFSGFNLSRTCKSPCATAVDKSAGMGAAIFKQIPSRQASYETLRGFVFYQVSAPSFFVNDSDKMESSQRNICPKLVQN